MTEEVKKSIHDLECISKRTMERIQPHLMSNSVLPLEEVSMMIDIVKDSAKIMKYAVDMKSHFEMHPDKRI